MREGLTRIRIVGAGALLLSGVVAGVGTVLPWLSVTPVAHGGPGLAQRYAVTYPGVDYGNGWFVILAAGLLALVTVLAVVTGAAWRDWLVVVPVAIGGLALGHWVATLNNGGGGFPAGVAVSLAGIVLATPAVALFHRGRLPGRLAVAAATLLATAMPFLSGGLLYSFAPISVFPVF